MWILLALLLAGALGLVIRRLVQHHRALARLHEAIQQQQPFLREEVPGAAGATWDALCVTVNERIEERRQLQQQQRGQLAQLDATLGSLQEAVLVVDAHNYIRLANRAFHALFPSAARTVEPRLERVLHSAAFLTYLDAVRREEAPPQQEVEFVEDPPSRWLEVTGTTIPALDDSRARWVLFVLHDITRQKQLERVRKEFVANVSHELRTPLSVIKGYIDTLVDEHVRMAEADRDRFLRTAQRHTERLNSLLDDLLLLSRLESGNPGLRQEQVGLAELLDGILVDYRSRPGAAQHRLQVEVDPTLKPLRLDPLRICQVFENLLDNAIKYSPAGTSVAINVRKSLDEVVATVTDNGPGIPAADLPHIFERFYRVEKGRSRDKGGTGLGLSIVKHIVQLHGGRVWAESAAGQGTSVSFSLPLPRAETTPASPVARSTAPTAGGSAES